MGLPAQYGLSLTKIATAVVAVVVIVAIIVNLAQHKEQRSELWMTNPGEHYKEMKESLAVALPNGLQQKQWHKAQKKKQKREAKATRMRAKLGNVEPEDKPRAWVLDFKGSMDIHEVNSLWEEVTAALAVAKARDQAVIRLENPDGMVHGYELATSQLQRLRDKQIPLTVAVDKVAVNGGHMMAYMANKIVSAPSTILSSIDVVAQIPNFHRFLRNKDIDIGLHIIRQYKQTLIMLGEDTKEGQYKFREDLNKMHHLFKDFVHRVRPGFDIEQVATGEHWYRVQALGKGLVDAVGISDGLLLELMESHEVIGARYQQRKKMLDHFTGSAAGSADRLLLRWWQHDQKPLM